MFETIFSWLANSLGSLLTWVINVFLSCMHLEIGIFYEVFPIVGQAYSIFQVIAIGLVAIIAGTQLMQFFGMGIEKPEDTPRSLLFGSLIASVLIFYGGHVVEIVIDAAKDPYEVFSSMAMGSTNISSFTGSGMISAIKSNSQVSAASALLGSGPLMILTLVVIALIAVNVVKLMIEIIERFLMVCLYTFTAPLVFSTVASKATRRVFSRWVSMFISELILMSLSSFSLALILTGLSTAASATSLALWLELLMVFAMCKLALRMDDYLGQLMPTARTGQDLLDDVIGGFHALTAFGRGGVRRVGSKDDVLDPNSSPSMVGGVLGGMQVALQKTRQAAIKGELTGEDGTIQKRAVALNAAKGFALGTMGPLYRNGVVHRNEKAYQMIKDGREKEILQKKREGEEHLSKVQSSMTMHKQKALGEKEAVKETPLLQVKSKGGEDLGEYFAMNAALHGTGDFEAGGGTVLNKEAKESGLTIGEMENGLMVNGGPNERGDFMMQHLDEERVADLNMDQGRILSNTAVDMSSQEAYSAIMGSEIEIGEAGENGKTLPIREELIKKSFPSSTGDIQNEKWKDATIENTEYGRKIEIIYGKENVPWKKTIIDGASYASLKDGEKKEYTKVDEFHGTHHGKDRIAFYTKDRPMETERHKGLAPAKGYAFADSEKNDSKDK